MKVDSKYFFLILVVFFSFTGCTKKKKTQISQHTHTQLSTYSNPLLQRGARPWATFHNGIYYYMQDCENKIVLWRTKDITNISNADYKVVWVPKDKNNSYHLWAPELHLINNKWYIYFAADDGNTDNHQVYVIENNSEDPFEGEFNMIKRVKTDQDNNWAIHASIFNHNENLYMIWSGWQTKRSEVETQCIYIARMKNPWTLASERVLISKPEFEWERQWINPDGSKTGYPIYVNEDPHVFYTKNKDKILIYYAASGTWTPYYSVGLLYADVNSELTDPSSWTKVNSPVFSQNEENQVFATGSPCFIPSPNYKEVFFLYQARSTEKEPYGSLPSSSLDTRSPRLQKIEWDDNGFPILGEPLSEAETLEKPSGI